MTRRLSTSSCVLAMAFAGLVFGAVGESFGKAKNLLAVHERTVQATGPSASCNKNSVTLMTADEGDKVFWRLIYKCENDRDIWIEFQGDSPCEGDVATQKPHMTPGDRFYIKCVIKAGASAGGSATKPRRYHYKVKGLSNEDDPEIDVPPPILEDARR